MVNDNGLHPQDPDYDDYGYSDFVSDYMPSHDQLVEWFTDDPDGAIKTIESYAPGTLDASWCETHEQEMETEWDANHQPEGDY